MIFYVVLTPRGHVLKDLEVGGDDVIPRDRRQDPQLPDEDHGINVGVLGLHEAVFANIFAKGLIIKRLLRNF